MNAHIKIVLILHSCAKYTAMQNFFFMFCFLAFVRFSASGNNKIHWFLFFVFDPNSFAKPQIKPQKSPSTKKKDVKMQIFLKTNENVSIFSINANVF